jgi:anti-sigma-K factor RskA
MEPADVHTLTGAYAADALDDVERAAFERHLDACPDCTEEVRGLRETVGRLADGVAVVPPQRVRAAVLDRVAVTPQVRPPVPPARPGAAGAPVRPRRAPWLAAAAVLGAVSVGSGTVAWTQSQQAQEAQQFASRVAAVVADPRAQRATGTLVGGGDVTVVVANRRAVVVTAAMPALPEDRLYQLWIVRGPASSPRITSAGLGPQAADAGGSWARLVDEVRPGDTVALSVEPLGGSAQPTTTPVVTVRAA